MSIVSEFKSFAVKGNAIDLAIGVAIGAAFGQIVNSLVRDLIMPPVGVVTGGLDFSEFYINLSGGSFPSLAAATQAGAATINYGIFINALVNFLVVAWALFLVVKAMNRVRREFERKEAEALAVPPVPAPPAVPAPAAEHVLLAEIRDLLKAQAGPPHAGTPHAGTPQAGQPG